MIKIGMMDLKMIIIIVVVIVVVMMMMMIVIFNAVVDMLVSIVMRINKSS